MVAMLQFLSAVVLFFVIDCALVGTPLGWYVVLSRAFFYALILSKKPPYQYTIAGFFAIMPTFVRTGTWGADLICMVPLGFILAFIARVASLSVMARAVLVCICLYMHALLIDSLWSGLGCKRFMNVPIFLAYALISLGMVALISKRNR